MMDDDAGYEFRRRLFPAVRREPLVPPKRETPPPPEPPQQDWLDRLPWWKRRVLFFTSFPFVIAGRVLWQTYPGLGPCVLFWLIALVDEPIRWPEMRWRRRWFYGLSCLGSLGNAAATLANGGYMPVLGKAEPTSVWVPLTDESRLRWLCDIYGGASLGDGLILAGIVGLLVNWLLEKMEVIEPEPAVPGKRVPGVGIG